MLLGGVTPFGTICVVVAGAPGVARLINLIVVVVPSCGRGFRWDVGKRSLCGVVRLSIVSEEASTTNTLITIKYPLILNIATGCIFPVIQTFRRSIAFGKYFVNPVNENPLY